MRDLPINSFIADQVFSTLFWSFIILFEGYLHSDLRFILSKKFLYVLHLASLLPVQLL